MKHSQRKMTNEKLILLPILLTGCSMFTPETGTHYEVEYNDIKVKVDDYTDREGIEFEYTNPNGTSVTLKKNEVNTSNPAELSWVRLQKTKLRRLNC